MRMTEQDLLLAARDGALVVTANKRSARRLLRSYDEWRRTECDVWETPRILIWRAWLGSMWNEVVVRSPEAPVLLSTTQEVALWEQVIGVENGTAGRSRATAHLAASAWKLLHEYRLAFEKRIFAARPDTGAFFEWATEYQRRTGVNGWTDEARLPAQLSARLHSVTLPVRMFLHGFDRLTPQQDEFLAQLSKAGVVVEVAEVATESASASRISRSDSAAECEAVAYWSRERLNAGVKSIGIVLPRLDDIRSTLDRALLGALHPSSLSITSAETARAYEFSLGGSLANVPLVGTMLRLLRFAYEPLPVDEVGRLLRSPFLPGWEAEGSARGLLDSELRRKGKRDYTMESLFEFSANCRNQRANSPEFRGVLHKLQRAVRGTPDKLRPSEWAARIADVFSAASFADSRTLSSAEHQALAAWTELLGAYAELDLVEPSVRRSHIAERIAQLVTETTFQPENLGAPVQVLGMLEAAGSVFEEMWVMGLHEDVWPPAASPNPFLPLALQLHAGVPAASAASQYEYAQRVTQRLLRSAGTAIFSHPRTDGESELRPSPLIADFREMEENELLQSVVDWPEEIRASGANAIEHLHDSQGPPLSGEAHGGTSIFKLQAACPFRAFAELRLGAEPLESPQPGIDARDKGGVMHRALELIWKELKSQDALRKLQGAARAQLVSAHVDAALAEKKLGGASAWEAEIAKVERERLIGVLLLFLAMEEQRSRSFEVGPTESEAHVQIGSLNIRVKVDRIDHVNGVGDVVLDYKSSAPNLSVWKDERPDEPQLPIYTTKAAEKKMAGVAFAQVRGGDVCFKGVTEQDNVLPGVNSAIGRGETRVAYADLLSNWSTALDSLADEYERGVATVTPKDHSQTCRNCPMRSFCRVAEHKALSLEVEEERDGD